MKLLEAKGEEAISLIADLMMPVYELMQNEKVADCIRSKQAYKAIMFALKENTKTVLEIMAIAEGVPVEEYHPSVPEIPAKIMEIVNHPAFEPLFTSQTETTATSSGSVTENTEVD